MKSTKARPQALTLASAVGAAALAFGLVVSCGERGGVTGPGASPDPADPSPAVTGSVEAILALGRHEDGEQSVVVRIEGEDLVVGAYQGRLQFDASTLSLAGVVKGKGGDGSDEFRVVNDRRAEQGELRFAAYAVEHFADPVALELVFETSRAIEASDLELDLEVVGTAEGKAVPRERTSLRELIR